MIILQIEHPVPDYNAWKKAFDSDPVGRKQSGVKSHKIFRQSDNANNIIVDLEFETIDDAINLQAKLKKLWNQVEGTIITGPRSKIIENDRKPDISIK